MLGLSVVLWIPFPLGCTVTSVNLQAEDTPAIQLSQINSIHLKTTEFTDFAHLFSKHRTWATPYKWRKSQPGSWCYKITLFLLLLAANWSSGLQRCPSTSHLSTYLFLSLRRLSQRSRHSGGAAVGGRGNLVPGSSGAAYLEAAGNHPWQTGVC